jgi:hypothetical protein
MDLLGKLDPVAARHADVRYDGLGFELCNQPYRIATIVCLTDDLEILFIEHGL